MSTASKVTLLSTILGTAGIVAFVHWAQTAEQAVCIALCLESYLDNSDRYRPCMLALSEIWSSNESNVKGKQISRCKSNWRKNTKRHKMCTTVQQELDPRNTVHTLRLGGTKYQVSGLRLADFPCDLCIRQ